jgi:hypothetical protein
MISDEHPGNPQSSYVATMPTEANCLRPRTRTLSTAPKRILHQSITVKSYSTTRRACFPASTSGKVRILSANSQPDARRASGRPCGPSVPSLGAMAPARSTGTTTTTSKAPRNKKNAITYKPTSKRWVKSPIQPTR